LNESLVDRIGYGREERRGLRFKLTVKLGCQRESVDIDSTAVSPEEGRAEVRAATRNGLST